jgi:hypothetical protein
MTKRALSNNETYCISALGILIRHPFQISLIINQSAIEHTALSVAAKWSRLADKIDPTHTFLAKNLLCGETWKEHGGDQLFLAPLRRRT